jgi:hypothetical protein
MSFQPFLNLLLLSKCLGLGVKSQQHLLVLKRVLLENMWSLLKLVTGRSNDRLDFSTVDHRVTSELEIMLEGKANPELAPLPKLRPRL